ncbi:hypothetical protein [Brochothrix phage ADU4]|nr:hypothetical protein [Brochothrix phage ADU4]
MYNAFSHAIKEVQDNVPLEANILNKTGDVIGGTILSAPKQIKYSISKGNTRVQGNVTNFSNVSGDSKITITIPKDVVIPGRQTLVFSFLHSFKDEVISLDFSSTYVSDFATTNTDNIKNDEYRKVRLSFTLGENAHNADIVIVMSARERNLVSCTIAEDFVTSGLIGVPYSLKADSLIALDEGAMLPKSTQSTLDCNTIRTPYIGYTANAINAPQGEKLGTLMVFVTAETSKLTQVFTGNTSGKVYYRTMNIANTFSSWAEVLTGSALADALTNYTTKEDLKKATAGMLTEGSATNWQKFKVTDDSGISIMKSGYDLLNVDDLTNLDVYVTSATNIPAVGNSGFYTRRVRSGPYIDVTFAQHSTASLIWRNSYNGGVNKWSGWTKLITEEVTATWQKKAITADSGAQLRLENVDLNVSVVPGEYYANSCTNTPSSEGNGYLTIKAGNLGGSNVNNYFTQIYTGYVSGEMYSRSKKQGDPLTAWTPWVKLLSEHDSMLDTSNKSRIYLPAGADILTLPSGFYEGTKIANSPYPDTDASWKLVDVFQASSGGRKEFKVVQNADGRLWYKTIHTDGVGGRDWWTVADSGVTQNNKVTGDDGMPLLYLSNSADDLLDVVNRNPGFKSGYAHYTVSNGLGNGRSFRFIANTFNKNGYIHAVDTQGQSYTRTLNGGVWSTWQSVATYEALNSASARNFEFIDAITPVTLWEGSAQGGTGTYYKLKRPITDFTRIKVWHSSSVYKYNVSEFYVPSSTEGLGSFIIGATNLADATGGSPTIYELALDFSRVTSFTIPRDSRYNVVNSEAILKSNSTIIQKVEGIVK